MTVLSRRQLGRNDRYVRRGRLSLGSHAPRHKLAFLAEESLRLCSLPGEAEGRVYYFRHLRVAGLPEEGDRRAWLDAFQAAMTEQAAQAIHGSDSRAAAANAVYFRSEQEACEGLLTLVAARVMPSAWFWPRVSGTNNLNAAAQITGVIEKLWATPASWSAVAAAILPVARRQDVGALLRMLPDQAIERWLCEMGALDSAHAAPLRFSESTRAMLARAIRVFGPEAPVVLWLASLAVIAVEPVSVENRSALRIARASVRTMIVESAAIARAHESPAADAGTSVTAKGALSALNREKGLAGANPQAEQTSAPALADSDASATPIRDEHCFGEPTTGAGLYFLLNALRHLGVDERHSSLLFLARLFSCIADHARIETGDPILRWVELIEEESEPEEIDERLVRLWMLKIRRWCWRNGRITVREIVRRPGYVTLTRTDLDVTLPIDSADVRIRRIGLDLDPGWLPWFGRVVRFHYKYRGEILG